MTRALPFLLVIAAVATFLVLANLAGMVPQGCGR